ncbi:DivIVA domain-containing protein [Acetivibrio ethanolgignens]|uniref:Cell division protein DivIVA n=1 Tax=Acetivibrio ethanolgignens TaxID=290052 RepID=A0A0V8QH82_9FIRM|nr:DivIVA domain-containing protein [Acetivibrio ethanolgignens]KSV59928.1 hypothetical protein ASU35_07250 [Acetivibrio ethanolgignens]
MLTPVEMQGKALKSGFGYKKKETDDFLEEIFESYEKVYKENVELRDKLAVLNEGLQYYKDLESTLQKTLLVAEKTAESTKAASLKKAAAIEKNATVKAQMTLSDAKKAIDKIQNQTVVLMQQFENYRQQYKQILNAQMELLDSKAYSLPAFEPINIEIPSFDATSDTEDLADLAEQLSNVENEAKEAFAAAAKEVLEEEQPKAEITEPKVSEEASVAATVEEELPLDKISLEMPTAEEQIPAEVEDSFEFLDI